MPSLDQHQSNEYTKMLVMGDPGTGKTGGLASLVKAGYWLGILDYDNGLDPLRQFVEKECPDKIKNVEYRSLSDKFKTGPDGPVVDGSATAFREGLRMLDNWKYGETDYGNPADWGPGRILVVDSLTKMCKSAFDWREQLVMGKAGKYDQRAVYYDTQKQVEKGVVAKLFSEQYKTNVIIITHVHYIEDEVGVRKGYPRTIGSALSPIVGIYFNSLIQFETKGGKRTIRTIPSATVDLKNPKPFAMAPSYPIETGMADIFDVLRGKIKPKAQLRRV